MSLYRKYRPKNFREIAGQDFVKVSLANALRLGRLAGAYLFHGSHGTGKTSVARIFAKGLNCLALEPDGNPCGKCAHCEAADRQAFLDLVEIDGASYNNVDTVRDLIDKARFQPGEGKYKIYVIDEVHMLSRGAFNALLKTLEEPPAHVKFILATTEIDKIPDTILSRALRYDFKKIPEPLIAARLAEVCGLEGISAEPAALDMVARAADGGMRDALTLLEQLSVSGPVTLEAAERDLGLSGHDFLEGLFSACRSGDRAAALDAVGRLKAKGVPPRAFLEEALFFLSEKMGASLGSPDFFFWRDAYAAAEDRWQAARELPSPSLVFDVLAFGLLQKASGVSAPAPFPPAAVPAPAPVSAAPAPRAPGEARPSPAPAKRYFSGDVERPAAPARPVEEAPKPRVPRFIADAPSAPAAKPAPEAPKAVPAPAPAVPEAPAAPKEFSLAAWSEAAKKEGAKGAVAIALKAASVEKSGGRAVLSANNAANASALRGATGVLEVAHKLAFGEAVTVEVVEKERPADLAGQASEIFG